MMTTTRWTMFLSVVLLCGCGGDDDDSGPDVCGVEEPLEGTSFEELGKLARIAFQEKEHEGSPTERFANANFVDFSLYDADAPPTNNFDLVCSQVVGLEVTRTPASPLHSPESATISVGAEETEFDLLGEIEQGQMRASDLAAVDAGTMVAVNVVGGDAADEFPSFEAEAEAPAAPLSLSMELQPTGELALHWTPAGAEGIVVELWVLDPDPDFHPVRCVVADDGCLTVSSQAAGFLFGGVEPTPLDVRVSSVSSGQWDGPDGEVGFLNIERRRDIAYTP